MPRRRPSAPRPAVSGGRRRHPSRRSRGPRRPAASSHRPRRIAGSPVSARGAIATRRRWITQCRNSSWTSPSTRCRNATEGSGRGRTPAGVRLVRVPRETMNYPLRPHFQRRSDAGQCCVSPEVMGGAGILACPGQTGMSAPPVTVTGWPTREDLNFRKAYWYRLAAVLMLTPTISAI